MSSNVSLDQILGELEKTENVTDNQIVNNLLNAENVELKTEIPIPPSAQNAATLRLLQSLVSKGFSPQAAKPLKTHFDDSLKFAISHERGSREEIVKIFTKSPRQSSTPETGKQKNDLLGSLYGR